MLVAVACVAVAAAFHLPALLLPAGAIVLALGVRIAYNHRGAGEIYVGATHERVAWWPRLAPATERMIDGSVIGSLGVVLFGMGLIWLFR
ncbi:MAG TPA: hypothetical protein VK488_13200 [Gaiellaceae bacterium]|nr:hypothetical protein [Gaiellaceae bacterium]